MPLSLIVDQMYRRIRQGVGGVRRTNESPDTKGYDPAQATDAFDKRWLAKYFHVGLTTRGRRR